MAISFLLIEHMPDGHQQLAGNGHDRFLFANMPSQAFKLGLPVGVMFDRYPGCFNQRSTQIAAPLFRDATPSIGFPDWWTLAPKPA